MERNEGLPAFPTPPNSQPGVFAHHGLTKREAFAMAAMQSLGCPFEYLLSPETGAMTARIRVEYPRLAVEYADALLSALATSANLKEPQQ